jgi:hypothetical protein
VPTEHRHEQLNKGRRMKSIKKFKLRRPKNKKSKESHESTETKINLLLRNLKVDRLRIQLEK